MTTPPAATGASRYHRWSGRLQPSWSTWLAMVTTGVRLQFQRPFVGVLLLLAGGYVAGTCTVFYLISLLEVLAGTQQARELYEITRALLGVDLRGVSRIGAYRELLWGATYLFTIKVQMLWICVIVARTGPGVIADDLKTRALPIYFSKPVGPATYLLAKWMIVATFIGAVTLLPNLFSLLLGTAVTGGLDTVGQTLTLGVKLILMGLAVMLVGGSVMLALSSLSSDKRYVSMAWVAACMVPLIAQNILFESLPEESTRRWLGSIAMDQNLLHVARWLFDLESRFEEMQIPVKNYEMALWRSVEPLYPAVVLAAVTIVSLLVCYRRVVRFSRSAANA